MIRRSTIVLVLAALIGTAVAGCGPESGSTGPGIEATASAESTQPPEVTPDIPPSATSGASGLDTKGLDTELDAMERELDQMEMPSDADFSDAEGAVY